VGSWGADGAGGRLERLRLQIAALDPKQPLGERRDFNPFKPLAGAATSDGSEQIPATTADPTRQRRLSRPIFAASIPVVLGSRLAQKGQAARRRVPARFSPSRVHAEDGEIAVMPDST
jgi:hypothetical protein